MADQKSKLQQLFSVPVIVAALGYFVDIYDLLLFSIVRIPSLRSLGIPEDRVLDDGILLLNMQMAGMLIGGILWGVLGDKKGRLSVLFGSILLYSLANIGNGFVQTLDQYAVLRFIAGIGLAGELGAGITLVAEVLPKEVRGYGTTLIATVGMFGAVLAYFVADSFDWQIAYFIGGGMGLALLIMRVSVFESGIFLQLKTKTHVVKGDFFAIFTKWARLKRYLACIFVGLPIWYVVGILITFSPEFAKAMGINGPIEAGRSVMFCYVGLALGDLCSGVLSQLLKARKKAVLTFIVLSAISIGVYLLIPLRSVGLFYTVCLALGFSVGYWAVFVTMAAEQFGTNLRATVTTTVPNFIRGTVIPLTALFSLFKLSFSILHAALLLAIIVLVITLIAFTGLEDTYHKDLDYLEE